MIIVITTVNLFAVVYSYIIRFMKDATYRSLTVWSPLLILLVLFGFYALFVGIPTSYFYMDEGWAAELSSRILRGKLLYRDVVFPYGPLLPTIYATIFRFIGDIQFYHLRLVGLFVILTSGVILYSVSRSIVKNSWLSLLAPLALFSSLGLYQSCRLSASTLGGLLSLICLMIHLWDLAHPRLYKVAILGILIGTTFLTKHNIASIDLATHSIIILSRSKSGTVPQVKAALVRLSILYCMGFLAIISGCYLCHTTPAQF